MSHPVPPAEPGTDPQYFTADDVAAQIEAARREAIEQARKEERDKLYKQLDKGDDRFKEMQAEVKRAPGRRGGPGQRGSQGSRAGREGQAEGGRGRAVGQGAAG